MKSKIPNLLFLFASLLFTPFIYSQEEEKEFEPLYITVTTLHGTDGIDFDEWKSVEQEYFNSVTSKIDLILSHEVLVNYFSPKFSEIKIVNVIKSWDDIIRINELREDLIEKAWPNEDNRKAFFEKQNSFYSSFHSDEIYLSSNYGKSLSEDMKVNYKEPLVYLVKTNILSDNEDEDSYENYSKYVQNVIHKNSFIKAYYPQRHFWGADSREFIEVIVVNSLFDLENYLLKNKEIFKELVPNDEKRKEFLRSLESAIEGQTSEIFTNTPSLSK